MTSIQIGNRMGQQPYNPAAQPPQFPTAQPAGYNQFKDLGRFMGQVPGMYEQAMQPYQTSGGQMLGDTTNFYGQLEGALGTPQANLQNAFGSYQNMLSGMVPAMQAAQAAEVGGAFAPRMAAQTQALGYTQGRLGTGLTGTSREDALRAVFEQAGGRGSLYDIGTMAGNFAGLNAAEEARQFQEMMMAINGFETPNAWAGQAGGAYAQGANMFGSQMANNVLTPQNYLGLAGQFAQQNAQNRMAPWNSAMGLMGGGSASGGGGGSGNDVQNLGIYNTGGGAAPNPLAAAQDLWMKQTARGFQVS